MIGKTLDEEIKREVQALLTEDKFPRDYDDINTDTIAELIDRLIIVHIRYWYLEDAMSAETNDSKLADLRRKSEVLFKRKRPALVAAIDKAIVSILVGKETSESYNLKQYKNWEQ